LTFRTLPRFVILSALISILPLASGCGDGGGGGGLFPVSPVPQTGECGPRQGCWFPCFKEYEGNPVYDPGSKSTRRIGHLSFDE